MVNYKIILLDNENDLMKFLSAEDAKVSLAGDSDELLKSIKKNSYDVAIINPDIEKGRTESIVRAVLAERIPTLVILKKYDDVENIIEALSAGAFDYFQMPSFRIMDDAQKKSAMKDIMEKVRLASESKDRMIPSEISKDDTNICYNFKKSSEKIIVVGSSTGGPQSLDQIIPVMPKEIPGPIIIVQHMPELFTKKLAERLNSLSNVKVKEAEDGEELKDGVCYVAKGDYHLELKRNAQKKTIVLLNKKEKILGVRPCINVTMESAAKIYGKNAIGVILTGMGSDGTVGCKKIKEKGGTVIVESESTCIIYGMPKSVVNSGYYDAIVDLQKIPVAILQVMEV